MAHDVYDSIYDKLRAPNLQAGVWDKQPCNLHATCSVHMQRAMAELNVCDSNFKIIAVESVKGAANEYALKQTLLSAEEHGILDIGVSHGLCSKTVNTHSVLEKHSMYSLNDGVPQQHSN